MAVRSLRNIVNVAIVFSFCVVLLGAYTRLTHAGLGCPDWPGCYGKLILPQAKHALVSAQNQYPDTVLEVRKAWTEMVHRYAAGTLVLLLLVITFQTFRHRKTFPTGWKLSLGLFCLIGFQAVLGMWTVTWKLLPLVVMGHLLGGLCIFSGLCRLRLALSRQQPTMYLPQFKPWLCLAVFIVFVQVALGGWVSANYAGLGCLGFPQCNGQWLPALNLSEGFNLFSPIGQSYQGGLLDHPGRMTIHFVHRVGAVITALYLLTLCTLMLCYIREKKIRFFAQLTIVFVIIQFSLGIMNVVYFLPLSVAVLHNGMAALLLATVFMMQSLVKCKHLDAG